MPDTIWSRGVGRGDWAGRGGVGEHNCVDAGSSVVDLEPLVGLDEADFDAAPANVELEVGVVVADLAAAADAGA